MKAQVQNIKVIVKRKKRPFIKVRTATLRRHWVVGRREDDTVYVLPSNTGTTAAMRWLGGVNTTPSRFCLRTLALRQHWVARWREDNTLAATLVAGWKERDATLSISIFKVILKTNLQRLKISNIFSAKYGGGLPNPLFMKLPNGTEWKVIWEKDNGEIWLREGWKEFVEHYSLDHGHFVFFKYE
ncbi:hypothetical protein V8G54_036845 [Vigna mungo]|uniref:TF-B3 domain-containing protein n=1 Tax=Vigna mungo TaxID=3915 RepID=A0AAQ3REV5_VIGMU